jgi:hypothetical protein
MPNTVNVEGVGQVDFPDNFTPEDIQRAIATNPAFDAAKRSRVSPDVQPITPVQSIQPVTAQAPVEIAPEAAPPPYQRNWMDLPSNILAPFTRGLIAGPEAVVGTLGALADTALSTARNIGIPIPEGSPGEFTSRLIRRKIEEFTPMSPDAGRTFLERAAMAASGGVGNILGLVGGGLLGLGTKGAAALGTLSEAYDAYRSEIERQEQAGEPLDLAKARLKGSVYGALTVPIEALGAPRILRRLASTPTTRGIRPVLAAGAVEAGVGAGQEIAEQGLQDLIVEGRIKPESLLLAGIGGAFGQGVLGGVSERLAQRAAQTAATSAITGRQASPEARAAAQRIAVLNQSAVGRGTDLTPEESAESEKLTQLILDEQGRYNNAIRNIGAQDEDQQARIIEQLKLQQPDLGVPELQRIGSLISEGRVAAEAQALAAQMKSGAKVDPQAAARRIHQNSLDIADLLGIGNIQAPEGTPAEISKIFNDVQALVSGQETIGSLHANAQMNDQQRQAVELLAQNYTPQIVLPTASAALVSGLAPADLWNMAGRATDIAAQWFQTAQQAQEARRDQEAQRRLRGLGETQAQGQTPAPGGTVQVPPAGTTPPAPSRVLQTPTLGPTPSFAVPDSDFLINEWKKTDQQTHIYDWLQTPEGQKAIASAPTTQQQLLPVDLLQLIHATGATIAIDPTVRIMSVTADRHGKGDIVFKINPAAFAVSSLHKAKDIPGYFASGFREEKIHIATFQAIKNKWLREGKKGDFNTYFNKYTAEIAAELPADLKQEIQDRYGAKLGDAAIVSEYVRQLAQQARDGEITEQYRHGLTDKVKAFIKDLANTLLQFANLTGSPGMRELYLETQRILDVAEGKVTGDVTATAPTGTAQAQITPTTATPSAPVVGVAPIPSQQALTAMVTRPGVQAPEQAILERQAAVQTQMVPQPLSSELERWLVDPNATREEQLAGVMLKPILDMVTATMQRADIAALPVEERKAAALQALAIDERFRAAKLRLETAFGTNADALLTAINDIPKSMAKEAAANYHNNAARQIQSGYVRYLRLAMRTSTDPTILSQLRALYDSARQKADKQLLDPETVNRILTQLADNPAIPAGPGVKPNDILNAAIASGIPTGPNPDTIMLLFRGGPGRLGPGLARISNLGNILLTMRNLRSEKSTADAEMRAFGSTFGKPSGTVTAGEFSRAFEKHVRANERAAAIASELNQRLGRLMTRDKALKLAIGWLTDVAATPEYQNQVQQSSNLLDIMPQTALQEDPANGGWRINTPRRNSYLISEQPGATTETENRQKLRTAAAEIAAYLADPTSDPLLRPGYTNILMWIQLELSDQGLAQQDVTLRGRTLRAKAQLFPFLRTLQNDLFEIGGRPAKEAIAAGAALNLMVRLNKVLAENKKYGNHAISVAFGEAMLAHKLDPKDPKAQELYKEQIANPLFNSQATTGGLYQEVGSTSIFDHKVLPEDWKLMLLVHQHYQHLLNQTEEQLEHYGAETRINESIGTANIRRKAVAKGRYVFPRRFTRNLGGWTTEEFARQWQAWSAPEKRAWLNADPQFKNTILAFVTERNTDFQRGTPAYDKVFDRIALAYNDGNITITDWDQLIDAVANEMSVQRTPEFEDQLRGTILNALVKKIDAYTGEVVALPKAFAQIPGRFPGLEQITGGADAVRHAMIQSLKVDGPFISPREKMLMPGTWYQTSPITPLELGGLHAQTNSLARLNLFEKIMTLVGALERTKADYDKRIATSTKPRKQVLKEIRDEYKKGGLRWDYAALVQTLDHIKQQLSWYGGEMVKQQRDMNDVSQEMALRIQKALALNLLASVKSPISNLHGGVFLQTIMLRALMGQLNGSMLTDVGATTWSVFKNLFIGLARGINHLSPQVARAMGSVLKVFPPLYAGLQRQIAIQRATDQKLEASGSNAPFDFENRQKARKLFGYQGPQLPGEEAPWYLRMVRRLTENRFYDSLAALNPRLIDRLANVVNLQVSITGFIKYLASHADAIATARTGKTLDPTDESIKIRADELGIDETRMRWLRTYLQPAGGLEGLMFDYINRRNAVPPANRNSVDFFANFDQERAAINSLASIANVVSDTNSPSSFRQGPYHQMAGLFASWPANQKDTLAKLISFSRLGNPQKEAWQTGARALLAFLLVAILSMYNNELGEEVKQLVTGRTSGQTRLANVMEQPISKDGLRYALTALGTMVPYIGSASDRMLGGGSSRPLLDLANIVPVAGLAKDAADTIYKIVTGDPVAATADFANRWIPITQPVLSRIPVFSELNELRNATRAVRAAAPSSLEMRLPASGAFRPSPIASELRQIEAAAARGDAAGIQEAFTAAVEKQRVLRGITQRAAEQRVKSALRGRTLESRLFSRKLTEDERAELESRFTERQAEDVAKTRAAEQLIKGTVAGVSPTRTRKAKQVSLRPRRPRLAGVSGLRRRTGRRRETAPLRRSLRGTALRGASRPKKPGIVDLSSITA